MGKYTLLEVHLITGRSHQIRGHLAAIGHPIIGDSKYGKASINEAFQKHVKLKGQLLHACRMEFPNGTRIEAPLPKEFKQALEFARR